MPQGEGEGRSETDNVKEGAKGKGRRETDEARKKHTGLVIVAKECLGTAHSSRQVETVSVYEFESFAVSVGPQKGYALRLLILARNTAKTGAAGKKTRLMWSAGEKRLSREVE